MLEISPRTSIHELLKEYPFLVDFLVGYNPRFGILKNSVMRATVGRAATLEKASEMSGVPLEELLGAIRTEVGNRENTEATSASEGLAGGKGEPARDGDLAGGGEPARASKVAELKNLIRDLHDGADPDAAKARFDAVIADVTPQEIGAMEEQLIREGMPVEEVQRLCDLHVAIVQDALDRNEEVEAAPGHPAHTYMAANHVITDVANRLGALCSNEGRSNVDGNAWASELTAALDEISGIDNHYVRKENELFPVLERHEVTGPSKVMWGVHDDIRALLKETRALLSDGCLDETAAKGMALARDVVEMVYKENKILLPLALQVLTEEEWADVRKGEDELGYAFYQPSDPFPFGATPTPVSGVGDAGSPAQSKGIGLPIVSAAPTAPLPQATDQAYVELGTGRLSIEQVDMLLRHLPIEISFVDAEGFVRYYSETEDRLFPRTPGAIGRHVENCHPPKSLHMVKEILQKFADGERDVAEFWIEMQGKFIHIRYFAVRNPEKDYLGCLEVTQDVTDIRALEGQRRLLEWS